MIRGFGMALLLFSITCLAVPAQGVEELFRSEAPSGGVASWTMSPDRSRAVYYDSSWKSVFAVETKQPGDATLLLEPYIPCDGCDADSPDEIHVTANGQRVIAIYGDGAIFSVPVDGSAEALKIATGVHPRVISSANPDWLVYQDRANVWKVRMDGTSPAQLLGAGVGQVDDTGRWAYLSHAMNLFRYALDDDGPGVLVNDKVYFYSLPTGTDLLVYATRVDFKAHLWISRRDGAGTAVEVGPVETDALMDGDSFAVSPDGSRIAVADETKFAEYLTNDPSVPIYVESLNGTIRESSLPAYSPDGRWLIFADCKYVYFRDQASQRVTVKIPVQANSFRPPTQTPVFSPFEEEVALYDGYLDNWTVFRLDALGPPLFTLHSSSASSFTFLPDGKHVAYADDYRLWLAGLDDSPPFVLQYLGSYQPPPVFAPDLGRVYFSAVRWYYEDVRLYSAPFTTDPPTQLSGNPKLKPGNLQVYGRNQNVLYFSANDGTGNSRAFFSLVDYKVHRVADHVLDYSFTPISKGDDCYYFDLRDVNSPALDVYTSKRGQPGEFQFTTMAGVDQFRPTKGGLFYTAISADVAHVVFHGDDGNEREILTVPAPQGVGVYFENAPDDLSRLLSIETDTSDSYYLLRPSGATKLPAFPIGLSQDGGSLLYARTLEAPGEVVQTVITSTPFFGAGGERFVLGPIPTSQRPEVRYYPWLNSLLLSENHNDTQLIPLSGAPILTLPKNMLISSLSEDLVLFYGGPCGEQSAAMGWAPLNAIDAPLCLPVPPGEGVDFPGAIVTRDKAYIVYRIEANGTGRYLYSAETTPPYRSHLLYATDEDHSLDFFAISPDMKSVAFGVVARDAINSVIYTAQLDGSGVTARSHPVQFGWFLQWNKDGILFQGSYDAPTYDRIFLARIEDGGTEGEGEGEPAGRYASADVNHDSRIDLGEVLRVVQLYNAGEFHCEAGTEDGYGLGGGDRACAAHTSDYAPRDWRIGLSELLRVVQLYRNGGYVACADAGTEDGFCLAP